MYELCMYVCIYVRQRKVHPRKGHECPYIEYRYISTLSGASALDWGGWLTLRPSRFTPEKNQAPFAQETGLAPQSFWIGAKISPQPGFDPLPSRP